ncbi:MAG: hypothetical protein WCJ37_11210 [Syntrophus sp. (in: bacteria)]
MGGQSRIKFNPITKEIEIEGSEQFVKAYFDKIQAMLSGAQEAVTAAPVKPKSTKAIKERAVKEKAIKEKPVRKAHQSKKTPVVAEPVIEQLAKKIRQSKKAQRVAKEEVPEVKGRRGDLSKTVLALILDSPEGITTAELKEKSGLKDRQIWAVIANAKKAGKIKQAKHGVYVGA